MFFSQRLSKIVVQFNSTPFNSLRVSMETGILSQSERYLGNLLDFNINMIWASLFIANKSGLSLEYC